MRVHPAPLELRSPPGNYWLFCFDAISTEHPIIHPPCLFVKSIKSLSTVQNFNMMGGSSLLFLRVLNLNLHGFV